MKKFGLIGLLVALLLSACGTAPEFNTSDALQGLGILDPQKGPAYTGYILGSDGTTPVKIRYQVVNGHAIYDGDIGIGAPSEVAKTPEELLEKKHDLSPQTFAHTGRSYWPNGIVPVIREANPPNLQAALDQIQAQVPGIKFVNYNGQARYLRFRYSSGGYWAECTPSTNCTVYIGSSGASKSILMHEVGHALGFVHEHQRCDRDNYIRMINPGSEASQFTKLCNYGVPMGSYDLNSIMHYNTYEFSVRHFTDLNGNDVQGYRNRNSISPGDVTQWRKLYPGTTSPGYATGTTANTGSYTGPYNLRSGPGTSYSVVGSVGSGVRVNIVCQKAGTSHTGPWGTTSLWDKLDSGKWISDAFVYTGSNGTVAPRCG